MQVAVRRTANAALHFFSTEKDMTRRRKIIVIIIAVVILAVNTYFLHRYYQNYKKYGTLYNPLKKAAKGGIPIVKAIEEFKHDNGLYPQYLNDIVPKYLKSSPEEWKYSWRYESFLLYRHNVWINFGVLYSGRENRVWLGDPSIPGAKLPILFKQSKLRKHPVSQEELFESTIREFDRRIKNGSNNILHCAAKVSFLFRKGHLKDARSQCEKVLEAHPDSFWPRMTLAYMDSMLGKEDRTLIEFIQWTDAHPSFDSYFYLHVLYRALGQKDDALAALQKAEKYLTKGDYIYRGEIDFLYPISHPGNAAEYAYKQKDYRLALKICDAWKKAEERSYSAFGLDLHTASYLALAEIEKAKALYEINPPGRFSDGLLRAIETADRTYNLFEGDEPDEVRLFADFGE